MKRKALYLPLFSVWLTVAVGFIASMGANHYAATKPSVLAPPSSVKDDARFHVVHVLSASCKCSKIVTEKILANEKDENLQIDESIVWIGEKNELYQGLVNKGFSIREPASHELDDDAIKGVPTLLVFNPQRQIVYAGGYSPERIQNIEQVHDREIVTSLLGKGKPTAFPIFGCVASQKYQKLIDPFSVKYAQGANQ